MPSVVVRFAQLGSHKETGQINDPHHLVAYRRGSFNGEGRVETTVCMRIAMSGTICHVHNDRSGTYKGAVGGRSLQVQVETGSRVCWPKRFFSYTHNQTKLQYHIPKPELKNKCLKENVKDYNHNNYKLFSYLMCNIIISNS